MGCSCYTAVVVVIYYLSTSPVAEQGPRCACPPLPALPCPSPPSPGTGLILTLVVLGTRASGNI